jgi:hypothetical protein
VKTFRTGIPNASFVRLMTSPHTNAQLDVVRRRDKHARQQKRIAYRAAREAKKIATEGQPHSLERYTSLVTVHERAFLERLRTKAGHGVIRFGWPDFLITVEGQRSFAVECKRDARDKLRASQRNMFPALEALGLQVVVWSPDRPDRLVPWRKWR